MTLIAGALLANTTQELSITTVVIAGAAGADRARRHGRRGDRGETRLVRVHRFNAALAPSDGLSFASLAEREGVSRSYFTRVVRLSYLTPDITQAILDGRQPRDLKAEKLLKHSRLLLAWHDQRTALGFA